MVRSRFIVISDSSFGLIALPHSVLNTCYFVIPYSMPFLHEITEVRHNTSHIKGKHIVRFLPYATAKLNHEDDKFCLQRVPRVDVDVPVLFNNSKPWKLEYSHIDPDVNERTYINMTRKLLQRRLISDEIANTYRVYIPIDRPG